MNQYLYRGEPIEDIEQWCKDNDTKMIRYKATRKMPCMFSGKIIEEKQCGQMPEIFFDNIRMADGWIYTKMEEE